MSTKVNSEALEAALSAIPTIFRSRIIKQYIDLKSAFIEGKHDSCGTRAGKFCEAMVRFLQEQLTGSHMPFGKSISNLPEVCGKFANAPTTFSESFRITIPRALAFLYTLRNKREMAHTSGDVDANQIDASVCVRVADWCLSELIRIVHTLSIEQAQALLDSIAIRRIPQVWEVAGRKRVLSSVLNNKQKTLVLLYSDEEDGIPTVGTPVEDLCEWTKHRNLGNFRRDVVRPLDLAGLIEYDSLDQIAIISPLGIKDVEENILPLIQ